MSVRITAATAVRVLEQIRHDRRTIAMLLIVPSLLLFLLSEMLGGPQFDSLGAQLLGMFPFITMFVVTSIAMLRERTSGTLERLMTMPLAKLDLLGGYGIAFALLATVPVAVEGSNLAGVGDEVAVLAAMIACAIGLGALTLRRRTA